MSEALLLSRSLPLPLLLLPLFLLLPVLLLLVVRYDLSAFQSGLVVSMSLLGALLGSLVALASGNRLGRRTELIMAAVLYGETLLAVYLVYQQCMSASLGVLWMPGVSNVLQTPLSLAVLLPAVKYSMIIKTRSYGVVLLIRQCTDLCQVTHTSDGQKHI